MFTAGFSAIIQSAAKGRNRLYLSEKTSSSMRWSEPIQRFSCLLNEESRTYRGITADDKDEWRSCPSRSSNSIITSETAGEHRTHLLVFLAEISLQRGEIPFKNFILLDDVRFVYRDGYSWQNTLYLCVAPEMCSWRYVSALNHSVALPWDRRRRHSWRDLLKTPRTDRETASC